MAVAAFLVLFIAYILIPSGLPKPIYIEFADVEAAAPPEEGVAQAQTTRPSASAPVEPAAPVIYPKLGDGIMYDMGSRIVNLLDPVGRRYLKITVVIEFLPPDYAYYTLPEEEREVVRTEVLHEIETRKPVIDDMLTSLLSSKSYEDIYNLDGKNRLRSEIQERLNQLIGEPQVLAVYLTDFIVQ
mgnify:CR=1 FL=1